ncbi:rRNA-binding ribosome biosynthesis protein rpf2 [Lecanora helva]
MLRQIKPKTARSARALASHSPQTVENPKTALLLHYTTTSSLLTTLLTDIHSLKTPYSIRFHKKNPIHPFLDPSSLEFFSQKNDTSLLLFASHSKKRPHGLTFVRCFDGRVLDMLELGVVPESVRTLRQFVGGKCKSGVKPLLQFSGTRFESAGGEDEYTLAKSLFLDFFRGAEVGEAEVEGLQLLISFLVGEEEEGGGKPLIHMRCWRIVTKRSGGRVPRVEVEEMGPRIDFRVGRCQRAEEGMWKEVMRRAKGKEGKAKKNVETDRVGDKIGRIHLGRQDLSGLQTRKMKGLKRRRGGSEEDEGEGMEGIEEDIVSVDEGDADEEAEGGASVKRLRVE